LSQKTVSFYGSAASPDGFPRDGSPEVAFLGRSNVGKSSLLNALAGIAGLARVSSTPGRTRLVNFFRLAGGGWPDLYLVDLPGYGYAEAPRAEREGWERLATSYLLGRDPLALCVFLVDARHEPTENDTTLKTWLDHHRLPYVIAATKADKLGRGDLKKRCASLEQDLGQNAQAVLPVSARTGSGIPELQKTIRAAAAAPDARN
jgi:GTP-binding protein